MLVVDGDRGSTTLARITLEESGFRVLTAGSGADALRLLERHRPDVMVVDLSLPSMSGYDLMRRVHERTNIPVVMVSLRANNAERVRGLELGADDYLPKPYSPEELSARLSAILRRASRSEPPASPPMRVRNLEIDRDARVVRLSGRVVPLNMTEWRILELLARHAGEIVANGALLSELRGQGRRADLQYLRVVIFRLRQKLEPGGADVSVIHTFAREGYMLEAPPLREGQPAVDRSAQAGTTASTVEEPSPRPGSGRGRRRGGTRCRRGRPVGS